MFKKEILVDGKAHTQNGVVHKRNISKIQKARKMWDLDVSVMRCEF
jgi:hypothetical protein